MIVVHRRLTWSHLGVGARGVEEVSDSDSELSSSLYEDFILVTTNNCRPENVLLPSCSG